MIRAQPSRSSCNQAPTCGSAWPLLVLLVKLWVARGLSWGEACADSSPFWYCSTAAGQQALLHARHCAEPHWIEQGSAALGRQAASCTCYCDTNGLSQSPACTQFAVVLQALPVSPDLGAACCVTHQVQHRRPAPCCVVPQVRHGAQLPVLAQLAEHVVRRLVRWQDARGCQPALVQAGQPGPLHSIHHEQGGVGHAGRMCASSQYGQQAGQLVDTKGDIPCRRGHGRRSLVPRTMCQLSMTVPAQLSCPPG